MITDFDYWKCTTPTCCWRTSWIFFLKELHYMVTWNIRHSWNLNWAMFVQIHYLIINREKQVCWIKSPCVQIRCTVLWFSKEVTIVKQEYVNIAVQIWHLIGFVTHKLHNFFDAFFLVWLFWCVSSLLLSN